MGPPDRPLCLARASSPRLRRQVRVLRTPASRFAMLGMVVGTMGIAAACSDGGSGERPGAGHAAGLGLDGIEVVYGPELVAAPAAGFTSESRLLPLEDGAGFLVGPTVVTGELGWFDAQGTLLRWTGGSGSGPGEFSGSLHFARHPGDSVAVFDLRPLRVSILSAHDPEVPARIERLPVAPIANPFSNWIRVADHWFVAGVPEGGPGGDGPLARVTQEGVLDRTFGGSRGEWRADRPWEVGRALAPGGDGASFWALRYNEPVLERWGTDGVPREVFQVGEGWFEPWEAHNPRAPFFEPPDPNMSGLWEDAQGRVWILALVPAADWRPLGEEGRRRDFDLDLINELYDVFIEVVDPARGGEVVAQARLPHRTFTTGVSGWVFSQYHREDGELVLQPLRLTLPPGG